MCDLISSYLVLQFLNNSNLLHCVKLENEKVYEYHIKQPKDGLTL